MDEIVELTQNERFYAACYQGEVEVAKDSLAKGADLNYRATNGWTSLHAACYSGVLDVVKFLCSKGIDVEVVNLLMQRPLHMAASGGRFEVAQWLCDIMSADIKAKTAGGGTAVEIAKHGGHAELAEMLALRAS